MKKQYKALEIEIREFLSQDIVTESGFDGEWFGDDMDWGVKK